MTINEFPVRAVRAHELYGDVWFNGEPVPVAGQRGGVILLFFWDYSCTLCLQVLPYVQQWYRKYGEHGLVVVGVHTPKFPFARDPERVDKAIRRLGITFPVVMDNGMHIWGRYTMRQWPSLCVVDKEGSVRFVNEGEGNILATERAIQTMMLDARLLDDTPDLTPPLRDEDRPGVVLYRSTPELFGGYARGSIGNVEGSVPEAPTTYRDPGIYMHSRLYLTGNWMSGRDALHALTSDELPSGMVMEYSALEVQGVLMPGDNGPVELLVEQDDLPVTEESRGSDVTIGSDGQSRMVLDDARLYSIVRNARHGTHVLRLTAKEGAFSVYSMTFVTSVIPELITDS